MDFGEVLKRAGEITWRFKGLWVLGILASCSGRRGGGGSNATNGIQYQLDSGEFGQLEQFVTSVDQTVWIALGILLVVVFLILALVFFVLGIMGQAGLIHGFDRADEGEVVTLASAFKGGLTHFWRLLGLQLLLLGAALVLLLPALIGLVLFTIGTLGLGLLCLCCLSIPLAIAFGTWIQLSQTAVVVDSLDIFRGLGTGWGTIRDNPGPVIVMALILVVGGALVGLLMVFPLLALVVPVLFGILIDTQISITVGAVLTGIGFLILLPILILLSGILETYIQGAWTITYRRLTDRPGVEELATSG